MQNYASILRPLGMGELFDRAIRLYRRNFFKFVGVLAIMQIPLAGINLIVNLASYDSSILVIPDPAELAAQTDPFSVFGPDYFSTIFTNIFVTIVYLVLVSGIASAAITRLAADSYLELPTTSEALFGAYEAIGDRWSTLVGAIGRYVFLFLMGFAWTMIPCIGWFTGPGILFVLAGLVLPLVAPVVVLERKSAGMSIRRAWHLVRGRFWWVLGFMLLLFLFNWVVVGGPSLLVGMALGFILPEQIAFDNPQLLYNIQVSVQALSDMVFNSLYLPLQLTCLTLLYFDLRVRKEGLDLSLAAAAESGQKFSTLEHVAATAPVPEGALVRATEWVYFIGITFVFLAVYLILVFGLTFIIYSASGL